MSKRLKNYPDPVNVVNKFGADALHLYLVNSPVVRAETLKFKESGVKGRGEGRLPPLVQCLQVPYAECGETQGRFLMQNVERLKEEDEVSFECKEDFMSIMDQWILSFTQSLIRDEMAKYHLYTVMPRLIKFIEQLTNWYVRFNRKRIKGEQGREDCLQSMQTLCSVVYLMTCMMAPFTPFFT